MARRPTDRVRTVTRVVGAPGRVVAKKPPERVRVPEPVKVEEKPKAKEPEIEIKSLEIKKVEEVK